MDLKSNFYNIFKTLNPYSYNELTDRRFHKALTYLVFVTIVSTLIMFLLFVPFLFYYSSYVREDISHFQTFNLSSNFELKESFNLMSDPIVRFEPSKKNISSEFVVVSPDTLSYKRFLLFGKQVDVPFKQSTDLAQNASSPKLLTLGLIFLLPSLLFWSILLFLIYFSVLIFFASIIAVTIASIFKIHLSFLRIVKICIYASTIFILTQLLLMPFFRLMFIPLVAYLVLVILVIFVVKDKLDEDKGNFGNNKSNFGYSSKKNIFDDDRPKRKIVIPPGKGPVQDSYDVDENGNLKGSKFKKNFSNDDDGYVELK